MSLQQYGTTSLQNVHNLILIPRRGITDDVDMDRRARTLSHAWDCMTWQHLSKKKNRSELKLLISTSYSGWYHISGTHDINFVFTVREILISTTSRISGKLERRALTNLLQCFLLCVRVNFFLQVSLAQQLRSSSAFQCLLVTVCRLKTLTSSLSGLFARSAPSCSFTSSLTCEQTRTQLFSSTDCRRAVNIETGNR